MCVSVYQFWRVISCDVLITRVVTDRTALKGVGWFGFVVSLCHLMPLDTGVAEGEGTIGMCRATCNGVQRYNVFFTAHQVNSLSSRFC